MADPLAWIEPDWPAPASVFALSTTRAGGCSAAPYHSFNLGDRVGDDVVSVANNRRGLQSALPPGTTIQWLRQVHGAEVVAAAGGAPAADASWSHSPAFACAVMTADCLPVLFCDCQGSVVAAAHAGWRGLVAGVLEATVEAMNVDARHLLAWLGPAIGPEAFEVGAEVRRQFIAASGGASEQQVAGCFLPASRAGRYLADIYALARLRLRSTGVDAIYGGSFCTFSDSRRFYSYRRDGETGRMVSLVGLRDTTIR